MRVRAVIGLMVAVFLGFDGLAQQSGEFLAAINIEKQADVTLLEHMQLPVYYRYDDVLVTELAAPQLSLLRGRGFRVTILDEDPDRGRYSLLSAVGRPLRDDDAGSARILYRHPDGWIVSDLQPGERETGEDGLIVAPMWKTQWRFAAERTIPAVSLRADLDSLVAQIVSHVNADTVRSFVQALQDFGTRYSHAATRDAVADWIKGQFMRMGYAEVVLDSFQFSGTWQVNVVATFPAATPSDEVIVIGGHHDSITGIDPMNYAPGADDNASGTTAVLEIARVLKLLDFKPEVTFKLVTFAAEERGLLGSHDYAEKALQSGMNIRLMINHDMISHTVSPFESSTFDINYYTGSAGYLELARLAGQQFSAVPPRTGTRNSGGSDSYSFWVRGFRTVYFEESDFSPYWHTNDDVISNYSMEYCAEVIKASCATLIASSMLPSEVRELVVNDMGDGSSLLVRWDESRDFDHSEYRVHLGTASGIYDTVFSTSDTSVVLDGLDEGVTYYVGVSSIDVEGYESYLAESSGIPYSAPLPPDRLRAHPEWHEVVLSWNPNTETDLLGYNVFRAAAPGEPALQLNSAVLQDTFFVDNTAQNGVYYYYSVIAVDSGLNESQATPAEKSRVVSLDRGLLLVDETKDGDGSPQNPSDAQTDAFYEALLDGFGITHHDVSEEGGVSLADLGAHSTVFWYGDDISETTVPLAAANEVKEYLDHGGRFLYAGYKPARAFSGDPALEAEFAPGDFVHDYLKIRATQNGLFSSLFRGALAAEGSYSDIRVDSSKARSQDQFHLRNIETIFAAPGGTEIYLYDSGFDTASAAGALKGNPVGVEYLGEDYKTVVLTFPLYYMGEAQATALVRHVLLDRFSEPTEVEPIAAGLPSSYMLHQNYPNPFNPSTRIAFDLPDNSRVSLKIFDVLGREVATLLDEQMEAGRHLVSWNADGMPSGVYFVRLDAGPFSGTRKLLLMK